jgi:hypothetical protein
MKRTYRLAKPEHFHFEDGTTEDRESVTVIPFGKSLSGRTVWADIDDDSMCYLVHDNKLWYYSGQVYGR